MTAVIHSVELFIPGTIQPKSTPEGYHVLRVAPQVTAEVRRSIVSRINCEQRMCSLLIVCVGLIFGIMMAYSAQQRGIGPDIPRQGLRSVLIAGVALLGYLQYHFNRQRRFVLTAPSTFAEVVEERVSPDEYDRLPSITPRLAICYTPLPEGGDAQGYSMLDGPCAAPTWADLEGSSGEIEKTLHAGDQVAIFYDPKDPTRVRIVEA